MKDLVKDMVVDARKERLKDELLALNNGEKK